MYIPKLALTNQGRWLHKLRIHSINNKLSAAKNGVTSNSTTGLVIDWEAKMDPQMSLSVNNVTKKFPTLNNFSRKFKSKMYFPIHSMKPTLSGYQTKDMIKK